jgi:hypothetical protein
VTVVAVDDNRNLPAKVTTHTVGVTDDTAPDPPASVKAFDNLDSDVLVTWLPGDFPDVELYEVYLEEAAFDSATGIEPAATVRGMRVSGHRIGGLEAGTTYHAAVVAVDWAGNADRGNASIPVTPTDVTAPPEVRGLDASTPQEPDSEGEALVKWRDTSADDVDRYNVYMSLTPIDSLQNFAPWASVPFGNTSLTVTGLNPGVTYHFALTAVDMVGHEGPSKFTVSAMASTAEPPETVVGVVAVQAGEDSVRLSWNAVNVTGAPVVNYRVYMSTRSITDLAEDGSLLVGNVTPTSDPTHLVTGLEVDVTYYFAVEAEDGRGRTSMGAPQVASVVLPKPQEVEPSLWEVYGPTITTVLIIVILALLVYVLVTRQRRYGRILSRRPSWERNGNNGGNSR